MAESLIGNHRRVFLSLTRAVPGPYENEIEVKIGAKRFDGKTPLRIVGGRTIASTRAVGDLAGIRSFPRETRIRLGIRRRCLIL